MKTFLTYVACALVGSLAAMVTLIALANSASAAKLEQSVVVKDLGQGKNDYIAPVAFLDKGNGIAELVAIACGSELTFTVNTKTVTPDQFKAFVSDTIDKVCN